MAQNTDFIFVYGLLKSFYDNEPARFIRENCKLIGEGWFSGSLFDLGNYPGAVFNPNSVFKVHGEVYQIMNNKEKLVAFLDHFEGVGAEFEVPHEYKREMIPVNTQNGSIIASTYLYNWNYDSLKVIATGRYINKQGERN